MYVPTTRDLGLDLYSKHVGSQADLQRKTVAGLLLLIEKDRYVSYHIIVGTIHGSYKCFFFAFLFLFYKHKIYLLVNVTTVKGIPSIERC